MIVTAVRFIWLICAMSLSVVPFASAGSISIAFTAMIGSGSIGDSNSIDTQNLFGEGFGANLWGQVITGSAVIGSTSLVERCSAGSACYGDFGAGAVSVSFTLNGITSSVVSAGTLGYFGNSSGGSVLISDAAHGLGNYLAAGAASTDGMLQQSIGVLFNAATVFSAYGGGDTGAAIDSLASIGSGAGLVGGGITLLSPVEHLDARIMTISAVGVPEPAGLPLLGVALAGFWVVRRRIVA